MGAFFIIPPSVLEGSYIIYGFCSTIYLPKH